jgi:hypothetical protein
MCRSLRVVVVVFSQAERWIFGSRGTLPIKAEKVAACQSGISIVKSFGFWNQGWGTARLRSHLNPPDLSGEAQLPINPEA